MINFVCVLIIVILSAWFLFFYKPNASKTLCAARWMLLTWILLLLIHIVSPVSYHSFTLSSSTLIYSFVWITSFCLGDKLGYYLKTNTLLVKRSKTRLSNPKTINIISILSVIGMAGLCFMRLGSMDLNLTTILYDLREVETAGSDTGLFKTVFTFLACGGLVSFSMSLSSAFLMNKKISRLSLLGLISYLSVSFLAAGRSAVILGGLSLFVASIASYQLSLSRNIKLKMIVLKFSLVAVLAMAYIISVVSTRTTSWVGTMDRKIDVINKLSASTLDDNFRESLRPLGTFGDTIIEIFYYLSPQLYGLEHGFNTYDGSFGLGAVQLPQITRQIEKILGLDILEIIYKADKYSFEQYGLAANFFRTAIHTTFLDFNLIFSIPYIFICGFIAGKLRKNAVMNKAPYDIAVQALICAGAAFTIIVSPSTEQAWTFPIIMFILLRISSQYIYPIVLLASYSHSCHRRILIEDSKSIPYKVKENIS